MASIGAFEVKAHLSSSLDRVAQGKGSPSPGKARSRRSVSPSRGATSPAPDPAWTESPPTATSATLRIAYQRSMRMPPDYDAMAAKRPVNLSLNADLVTKARAEGLNLSSIAEEAVAVALARRLRERWDADIAAACITHDRYRQRYGSLGDILREQDMADSPG